MSLLAAILLGTAGQIALKSAAAISRSLHNFSIRLRWSGSHSISWLPSAMYCETSLWGGRSYPGSYQPIGSGVLLIHQH
jgi:hypothetical protein